MKHVRKHTPFGLHTWCGNVTWKDLPGESILPGIDIALMSQQQVCVACLAEIHAEISNVFVSASIKQGVKR